jgi:tetratricopeptide (TPR) repeat protein
LSLLTLFLPLIAQVGPFTAPGTNGTPFEAGVHRPAKAAPAPAALPALSTKGKDCADAVNEDPDDALDMAETWLAGSKGAERAEANLCLGLAHSRLENWTSAEQSFVAGRDAAGADRLLRARLEAMAGNAALAASAPDRAIAMLDAAKADAAGLGSSTLETEIALDRARALVALKRLPDADAALADARLTGPDNAEAWLLSATLARRQNNLAEAQARIERAAQILPIDPAIGLEAGVIAMLAGHEEAARKSWQSVLTAGPESPEAETAKGYLAQLGPEPAAKPAPGR